MLPNLGKFVLGGLLMVRVAGSSFVDLSPRDLNLARNNVSASQLIDEALQALGGREALAALKGVTYESDRNFRVRTLMQNYGLDETDRYVIGYGFQNLSFSFNEGGWSQRIDRTYLPTDYFLFMKPEITPRNFSMVLKSGDEGFTCMNKGNNVVLLPEDVTHGYLDSAITEYLQLQGLKLSPKLLLEIETNSPVATAVEFRGTLFPAVHDSKTNITVVFDLESHLPLLVRTFEDHHIRGYIERDLHLFHYTEVEGILFPRGQKVILNGHAIIEETELSNIQVNPAFEDGFFDGLPQSETTTTPSPAKKIPGYEHAEIADYWTNMLWIGPYTGTYENVVASIPAADLPGAYHVRFSDAEALAQLVLEFEDSVLVFEAPPHQTDHVIRWVKENIGKPITHLWLSHHHHDHTYDMAKYVALGASVIVPEVAASYWGRVPGIKLITFTEDEPYIHYDSNMQARFLWRPNTPHSSDWTYAIVTTACPTANSSILAYTGDPFSEGFNIDSGSLNSWLLQALDDGLSKNATIVPAHGDPVSLPYALEILGSPYPPFNTTSFTRGGPICL